MPHAFADGRFRFAVGIEDTFVPQASVGRRALDEYELTQHYHRWYDDLGLARATGATAIRYGIPWYRVNPEPGRFRFGWLDRVVDRSSVKRASTANTPHSAGPAVGASRASSGHDRAGSVIRKAASCKASTTVSIVLVIRNT